MIGESMRTKLRIAWSVGWGVIALLLCVSWIHSYWRIYVLEVPIARKASVGIESWTGEIILSWYVTNALPWDFQSYPAKGWPNAHWKFTTTAPWPHGWIVLPYPLAVVFASLAAFAPWVRWSSHFSLRALLIATTLVAVVLGLVVWGVR